MFMLRELEDLYFWRKGELSDDEFDGEKFEDKFIKLALSKDKLTFPFEGEEITIKLKGHHATGRIAAGAVIARTLQNVSLPSSDCRHFLGKYGSRVHIQVFEQGLSLGRALLRPQGFDIKNRNNPYGALKGDYIFARWQVPSVPVSYPTEAVESFESIAGMLRFSFNLNPPRKKS